MIESLLENVFEKVSRQKKKTNYSLNSTKIWNNSYKCPNNNKSWMGKTYI